MTSPTDNAQSTHYDQARDDLLEGIESSREMLRQSRILLELSECDGSASNDNDDSAIND